MVQKKYKKFRVYPGSIFYGRPLVVKILGVLAREFVSIFSKETEIKHWYEGEGITSVHNSNFIYEKEFASSYASACQAVGQDFLIPYRVHLAQWAAANSLDIPGDLVELGTGRGFIMSSVLEYLSDYNHNKKVYLYDSFENQIPNPLTGRQDSGIKSPYYAESYESTQGTFKKFEFVKLVDGVLPYTLQKIVPEKISFLHIDLNHSNAEIQSFEILWNILSKNAFILLDDYANLGHEEQYDAWNDISKKMKFNILSTATGQGLIIK